MLTGSFTLVTRYLRYISQGFWITGFISQIMNIFRSTLSTFLEAPKQVANVTAEMTGKPVEIVKENTSQKTMG